jgi:DNA-binding Lrp family transcriptional regulator
MVSAVVLLKTHRGRVNEVATRLAELDGISEVFSVGGRYDLVAILRVRDNEAMADLVTEHMLKVDGIAESETLLAFRAFSRHDLESMFSLGLDE